MKKLENWTGNGCSDPDIDKRIAFARADAVELPQPKDFHGTLVTTFIAKWYPYFDSR